MFEFALRIVLIIASAGVILTAAQVALWASRPWWRPLVGGNPEIAVTIEPVGIIEGGKVKDVESGPIANQLMHRLTLISASLNRDLRDRYDVLQKAGISIPRTRVEGFETFQLTSDSDVSFEVEVFKFDVAGLFAYITRRLDKRDSVKAMVEIRNPSSRLFLDVSRVNGDPERIIIDSGPSLNDAIELAACTVMRTYRRKDELFSGLDAHGFCALVSVLEDFQDFIFRSANQVENGGQMEIAEAKALTKRMEGGPFLHGDSPVIHLLLASLYRLQNENAKALGRLERAAGIIPKHEFVQANLTAWRDEKKRLDSQNKALKAAKETPLTADELALTHKAILDQPELKRIRYPEMLAHLRTLPVVDTVTVAVFSTGFTPPQAAGVLSEVLKPVGTIANEGTEDVNGHGNMIIHLLAALTLEDRVRILPVKVLSNAGSGTDSDILKGFQLADQAGANVFAIPLGKEAPDAAAYEQVLNRVKAIPVAAAGNSARRKQDVFGPVTVPATVARVIAVGGQTPTGDWADFSPGPDGVDIAAPATDLVVSVNGREQRRITGTSFSTMIVAALIASARSVAPQLDEKTILKALQDTATKNAEGKPSTIDALAFIQRIESLTRNNG